MPPPPAPEKRKKKKWGKTQGWGEDGRGERGIYLSFCRFEKKKNLGSTSAFCCVFLRIYSPPSLDLARSRHPRPQLVAFFPFFLFPITQRHSNIYISFNGFFFFLFFVFFSFKVYIYREKQPCPRSLRFVSMIRWERIVRTTGPRYR